MDNQAQNMKSQNDVLDKGPFYHGTKADLKNGDFLEAGHRSNYNEGLPLSYIYFSATMDAAIWGAELSSGEGHGRVYIVEPTGDFEDDPNLTDKKFPGNPTRSYRSKRPLKVIGEVFEWEGHAPEVLQNMLNHLDKLKQTGEGAIID